MHKSSTFSQAAAQRRPSFAKRILRPVVESLPAEYLPGRVKAIVRAWTNPPVYPTFLQIEPTQRCNLKCLMRARHSGSFGRRTSLRA